jgi:hypothetical protein
MFRHCRIGKDAKFAQTVRPFPRAR